MPGDFTLGCLLGQYDQAQSFDVASIGGPSSVGSWFINFAASSIFFQNANVHSSEQGLEVRVNSNASASMISYSYGRVDDAHFRWFPDVTIHQLDLTFWAGIATAGTSGDTLIRLDGIGVIVNVIDRLNVASADALNFYQASTTVQSNGAEPSVLLRANVAATRFSQTFLDDVLLRVDQIDLFPEWSFIEQHRSIESQHRSLGAVHRQHHWENFGAWQVPLRFLSDSHAALLNWWWENDFRLAFTLDTSDSESIRTVQITNQQQPIGRRIRPDQNLWEGTLMLESIDRGSLVF